MARLDRYHGMRDFAATPEPDGSGVSATGGLAPAYSIQNHDATRLHWDLRLEWDGVLLSWAITRGPSLDPGEKRLAVETEDHPLDYLTFEGTIPEGNYGAGTVMLWDIGHWQPLMDVQKGLKKGHLHFALHGERMSGKWNLVRMNREGKRTNWLLMKEDDEAAHAPDPVERYKTSVVTNRGFDAIAKDEAPVPVAKRKGVTPKWRAPQLATQTDALGDPGSRWHELKFDGYRALCAVGKSGVRIFSRNGHDWTDRFAPLVRPLERLDCDTALIDAEVTVGAGLYGFGALQRAISAGGPFTLNAFDLLWLDGKSLVSQPLDARRDALEGLFDDTPPLGRLQLSPVLRGDADGAFQSICDTGGEGLISKRIDAPYRGGRSTVWQKIKCIKRDEFVILGWQASDKRGRPFASLLLGVEDAGGWVYVGKVGTGWDGETADDLAAKLKPLARKSAPVDVEAAEAKGVTWVTPRLVAEIRYAETTDQGRLRHATFIGLRDDKPPAQVVRPAAARLVAKDAITVSGVAISSADRVVFPKPKVTKGDVADYYAQVAERMLPDMADRPLSLVRLPEGLGGESFFQKHRGKGFPDAIRSIPIPEKNGGVEDYMTITTAEGLVGAAQVGTIEFHIWGSRRDRLERPDRMVFDLDPDEGLGFAKVRKAAFDVRDRLESLGLPSWPLLTGGKGIHVVVPLRRTADWPAVSLFARTFAAHLAAAEPKRFVATMSKAKREGRIFIDWMRNERGSTAIAPWSLRARPGAPVAVPVTWDELPSFRRANGVSIREALDRPVPDRPEPATLNARVVERLEAWVSDR
ncbi:DNA ligase D [Silicimonas algicola]|uniref:DNA ligase (ATP) n=1 Tax=Silicimonas algicola TaxID=1826607 RepID=A0A316G4F6_9RHOB|nr:DNA ligase D [Silicimonas algicola]AZQ68484.1 DNA ligase D [Silicimonas algicola]PWK55811.1 ATP-dependent DNA ligase LigD phosphoesterase module /ATP-dependent DNA ligase LigD polymerase module [Silicimonas algicola]